MVSEAPLTNKTAKPNDADCTKTCGGNSKEQCGKLSSRCIVWEVGEPSLILNVNKKTCFI